MPKIAFVGAGSTVFTRNLDRRRRAASPRSPDATTFSLDGHRPASGCETSELVARRLVEDAGAGATVETTLDRRAALEGADYVVTSFQVGGLRPSTVVDFEVPKRYGLRQTIADTLGVGGIMRGLRTIPVLLDVCRDMEEVCPDALLLQYVNPMAMLCWAVAEASPIRTVGLCHSVQHTAAELADDLGVPAEELDYHVAGINHVAFFLRLERGGEDLYPALRQVLEEGRVPDGQPRPLRAVAPLRLLRDGVLGALRGVRAVVHQGRPARPDRAASTSRSTSTCTAASARSPSGTTCGARLRADASPMGVERSAEYGARHHQRLRDRRRRTPSTATCRNTRDGASG